MAMYVNRIDLNRPMRTRLLIAVRFVASAAVSGVSSGVDNRRRLPQCIERREASVVSDAAQEAQNTCNAEDSATTVDERGTVAMRLRLVGQSVRVASSESIVTNDVTRYKMSTTKECHHAKSLPA